MAVPAVGFPGLLNTGAGRHWTVVVSDFALAPSDVARMRRQIARAPTRVIFTRIDSLQQRLQREGVDLERDYVSLQTLLSKYANIDRLESMFASLAHGDLVRIDLPFFLRRFRRSFATHALRVIMNGDYGEQERIAARFFHDLERLVPYRVVVRTASERELVIDDDIAWFQLAGRMGEREARSVPGGEVAYTGRSIDGEFTVDGALLPTPQEPSAGDAAVRIAALSRRLATRSLVIKIRAGRVAAFGGDVRAARVLESLLDADDRYAEVTEVGISFNRACGRFIHDWPAASNEGRPGVHIAIGADPDRRHETKGRAPLVHIDFMAARTNVWVNDVAFLQTS